MHARPRLLVIALAAMLGCDAGSNPPASRTARDASPAWLLAHAPETALPVAEAKSTAAEGDTLAVRGRIGGSREPLNADSPVFVIVDPSVKHCGDLGDDHCPTPWDYCCEPRESLITNSITVQIVGPDGAPIDADVVAAGLEPLDEVVVIGTVGPRPSEQVLTIRATGVYRVGG